MRQVVIYPGEDGYWVAECPSLLGCISQGKTRQEAVTNIKEADEDDQVVEIVSMANNDIDHLSDLVSQHPKASRFEIAEPGTPIPAGERIEFAVRDRLIPKYTNPPSLNRILKKGCEDGEGIKVMQLQLPDLGYYSGPIDGNFGRGTDGAVKDFQARVFGIAEADGKVGPRTWKSLFSKAFPDTPVPQHPEGPADKNYLRLTKTNRRDERGLIVLELAYFKNGKFQGSIPACSGIRGKQHFRKGKDNRSKSMEPLPEGRWYVGDMLWADGKDNYTGHIWKRGLGPVKIYLDYKQPGTTQRTFIEIHLDWNRKHSPGTAGCVGIHTVVGFKKLATWLRDTDPRDLFVDWGLGTCPDP